MAVGDVDGLVRVFELERDPCFVDVMFYVLMDT